MTSRDDWMTARLELLEREKAHLRESDELARARRALPRVKIDADYRFTGPDGEETLGELFAGRGQLAVYHFMFGADWEEGCPSCSFWGDGLNGLEVHLAARDVTLVLASTAPYEVLEAYRQRMGWTLKWVSSAGSSFNADFGVSFTPEELEAGTQVYNYRKQGFSGSEAPGFSSFSRGEDGDVYHHYSTYARGLESFNAAYRLLDLMPKGRDEDALSFTMSWLRRRDAY